MALTHRITTTVRGYDSMTVDSPNQGGPIADIVTQIVWPNGKGDGQANMLYSKSHTIAAGGALTLDFAAGGGLLQPDGSSIAMIKMKGLIITKTGDDGSFVVEVPAAGILHLAAAGDKTQAYDTDGDAYTFLKYTGATVTAGSADEILINETSTTDDVDIHVFAFGVTV